MSLSTSSLDTSSDVDLPTTNEPTSPPITNMSIHFEILEYLFARAEVIKRNDYSDQDRYINYVTQQATAYTHPSNDIEDSMRLRLSGYYEYELFPSGLFPLCVREITIYRGYRNEDMERRVIVIALAEFLQEPSATAFDVAVRRNAIERVNQLLVEWPLTEEVAGLLGFERSVEAVQEGRRGNKALAWH